MKVEQVKAYGKKGREISPALFLFLKNFIRFMLHEARREGPTKKILHSVRHWRIKGLIVFFRRLQLACRHRDKQGASTEPIQFLKNDTRDFFNER